MNRLLLLATGGTIAGCGENSATLNDYTAGVLGGDALLAAVPQLQELAAIGVEQIANVDSADLLFAHWRALVGRIRDAFAADPGLAGVVITHGTNTLEESAWLLQLLVDDPRLLVFSTCSNAAFRSLLFKRLSDLVNHRIDQNLSHFLCLIEQKISGIPDSHELVSCLDEQCTLVAYCRL